MTELYLFALVAYIIYKCVDKEALKDKIKNLEE